MSLHFSDRISCSSLLASAAVAALLAASPANATLIQTQGPSAFSGSNSVTATQSGVGSTTAAKSSTFASKSFSQFNSSTGVLTGVQVNLSSSRSESAALTASGGAGGARRADGASTGTNTLLSAPGISQSLGDLSIASFKCQPSGNPSCPRTVTAGPSATSANSSSSSLGSYVGGGNVTVNLTGDIGATALIENTSSGGPNAPYTSSSLQNTVSWSGNLSLDYQYLAHANPSFDALSDVDTLNVDFGTVTQGTGTYSQQFALTNLFATILASDTVGLDLDSITGPAGAPFSLIGGTFSNLGAGSTSSLYGLNFDSSVLGSFTDQILLNLSDFDAGAGMQNYVLTVNLSGNVVAPPPPPPASVPEPASAALLGSGLLMMRGIGRRKRRKAAA